jgi:hypothetical protein
MPKIAQSIAGLQATTPVSFYWHLGDFRRGRPDCDIVKRTQPDWDCANRTEDHVSEGTRNAYPSTAWNDFIQKQMRPFGVPVYLAIGNHERAVKSWTPDAIRSAFREWLTQDAIERQRALEAQRQITSPDGATYYDFVQNGVDFISLDNSDYTLPAEQLAWLRKVVAYAETAPEIQTIVVGMHAALPYSSARNHAMDMSCPGICSGSEAYGLLEHAKSRGKNVYVFASHSHRFEQNVFNLQKEHAGHALEGWVVGTAGAQQYLSDNKHERIQYGYALVEVRPDGKLTLSFREVERTDPPVETGTGETELADYCFKQNWHSLPNDATQDSCHCESAAP